MAELSEIQATSVAGLWYYDVLVKKESDRTQLWFSADVLDRYRSGDGFSVIRTDNAGRVKADRQWSLDFGIVDGERHIHAALGRLLGLPKREREHWAAHLVTLPVNEQFLQLQSQSGACMDDGEVRPF